MVASPPLLRFANRRRPGRTSLATQNAHGHRSGPLRGPPRYPCAFCFLTESLKSGEKVRKCAEICVFEVHGGGESEYLQQYNIVEVGVNKMSKAFRRESANSFSFGFQVSCMSPHTVPSIPKVWASNSIYNSYSRTRSSNCCPSEI